MTFRRFDVFWARVARAHVLHQYRRLRRSLHTAIQCQERLLLDMVARNAHSDYGREHGFSAIRGYADFTARVPVQTYEDHLPYIERVMAGQTRALFGAGQRVLMFAITSGTTDKPKYVPVTSPFLRAYRRGWHAFGGKAMLDHPHAFLRPIVQVVSPMGSHHTSAGIPCGAISGLLAAKQKRIVRKYFVTPRAIGHITDAEAKYYTIMRLAVPRDIGWMVTPNPATQLKLARAAAGHAERLVRDIHDGTLLPPADFPDHVRRDLVPYLQPDPRTSQKLTAILNRHGELLPRHYWDLAFLANWTGGTLGLHLRDFPHYFGDVPVRDIGLLATEGRVSIPLADGTPEGVLDVEGSFFEFVDVEGEATDPDAIHRCHEVVPGKEYRVLLTTWAGLYRYDIGDHVRVHRLEGQAPILEFLHRGDHVSSVTGEKLTEWQVTHAFDQARRALDVDCENFVLAPVWADPPYYRLHLEPPPGQDPHALHRVRQLSLALDRELCRLNVEYASRRASQRLGPITANVVAAGVLARVDNERIAGRAALSEQHKHRYLYRQPGDDQVFLDMSNCPRAKVLTF